MLTSTQDPATEAYYADALKRIFDVPSAKGVGATRATRDRNKIVSGGRFVALNGDNNSPTTARAWDCNGVLGPGLTTIADVLAGYAAESTATIARCPSARSIAIA